MRKGQRLSQEGLAALCGLHYTYIGAVERGECNVTFDNIQRITNGLNMGMDDLANGIEDQSRLLPEVDAKAQIAGITRGCNEAEIRFGMTILKAFLDRQIEGQPV
jgi:transcriptional regulator with XRE-family HTH domain